MELGNLQKRTVSRTWRDIFWLIGFAVSKTSIKLFDLYQIDRVFLALEKIGGGGGGGGGIASPEIDVSSFSKAVWDFYA